MTSAFPIHSLNITSYASFNGSHLYPLEFQHSFTTFTTFTTTPASADEGIQGLSSTSTSDSLQCPTFTKEDSEFKVAFSFWVEGVIQVILAGFGILGNILSCFVLTRKEMRNSFNLLLVTLATFDTCYLIGAILESLRKSFHSASDVHILMFPYFLYPLYQTSMAGSIFMTVAIAFERYSAVHLPVNYSQSLNDAHAMKRRLLKYIIPVCILSFLLNVPKFLEAEIKYQKVTMVPTTLSENDQSETLIGLLINPQFQAFYMKPVLSITPLRMHPLYSNYNNWSRLFVLGIIPFALLVFFNPKVKNKGLYARIRALNAFMPHPNRATSQRRSEDNLAAIFMGIILIFLICHFPRVMMNIHELAIIHRSASCAEADRPQFSLWSLIMISVSHVFLVLNSATNMIVYCLLSLKFRSECVKILSSVWIRK
ncbi:hypothetical protein TCAL_10256 [Tigriopus californicus]|uniref:G-protein coupled receptors family 1 profile domain-containing protein n=1 Tax=Tigriopus californicus TaxID=6832 RepID=A0A553NFW5_TIGCA|nr:hypothetical protein TCAL_10256 [Tigriopus californicus]